MFGRKNPSQKLIELDPEKLRNASDDDLYRLFIQKNWCQLSKKARLAALQEVENRRAKIDGRPPVPILSGESIDYKSNPAICGAYNPSNKDIHINYRYLEGDSGFHSGMGALEVVLHEGRHAYQHDVMDRSPEKISKAVLKEWLSSKVYYTNGSGGKNPVDKLKRFLIYMLQPIEMDARRFSRKVLLEKHEKFVQLGAPVEDIEREFNNNLNQEIILIQRVKALLTVKEIDELEDYIIRKMKDTFPEMDLKNVRIFDHARMILNSGNLNTMADYIDLIVKMDLMAERKIDKINDPMARKIEDHIH